MTGMSVSRIKALLESSREPLFGNRYILALHPKGGLAVSALGNTDKLGLMASRISVPGYTIEQAEFAIGTKNVGVPIQEYVDDISITFYNTGDEYKKLYTLKNAIYDPTKFTVAYYADIIVNIGIGVYDRGNHLIGTYSLQNCILKNLGTIDLSYDEATQVQTFDTLWSCLGMIYK